MSDVEILKSHGRCRSGKTAVYIRPAKECDNRSRRIACYPAFLQERINKAVSRWYTPMNYYNVDGYIIGSNSEENALKEYWRVCERGKMKKPLPVELINEPEKATV